MACTRARISSSSACEHDMLLPARARGRNTCCLARSSANAMASAFFYFADSSTGSHFFGFGGIEQRARENENGRGLSQWTIQYIR